MRFPGKQLKIQGNSVSNIQKFNLQGSEISHYEFQYLQKTGRFQGKEYKMKKMRT